MTSPQINPVRKCWYPFIFNSTFCQYWQRADGWGEGQCSAPDLELFLCLPMHGFRHHLEAYQGAAEEWLRLLPAALAVIKDMERPVSNRL